MSNSDQEKPCLDKAKTVYTTGEIITTKVHKVTPEQKEELDRLSATRLQELREEAIPKIHERYEQLVTLRRKEQPKEAGSLSEEMMESATGG